LFAISEKSLLLLSLLYFLLLAGPVLPSYAEADAHQSGIQAPNLLQSGISALKAGDLSTAEDQLTRASSEFLSITQRSPGNCAARYGLTVSLLSLGAAQYASGEKIRTAMKDVRNDSEFFGMLRYSQLRARSNRDAKEAARATVQCDPTNLSYRRLLAEALISWADVGGPFDRQAGYSEAADILEQLNRLGVGKPEDLSLINALRGRAR
jgi:predicted Zn-dependent protease